MRLGLRYDGRLHDRFGRSAHADQPDGRPPAAGGRGSPAVTHGPAGCPGSASWRHHVHLQAVPATVPAITGLAAELTAAGVQMVSMEATSDYWRIWVRHEAHCRIARSAGGNRRRCFSDLMAYQGPKG
jgi:hypothetical protein